MRFPRTSGILLHLTSLPGPDGIGDLGPQAYAFVDFLQKAGQQIWQILPLGPPAEGNSPYSCYSAFAGNPLLISLQELIRKGLLETSDLAEANGRLPSEGLPDAAVDYAAVADHKMPLLRLAYERFNQANNDETNQAFAQFCEQQASWLEDFARFESLLQHFQQADWSKWPEDLVKRAPAALAKWDAELSDSIRYSKFLQFVFDRQFVALKQYANDRHVLIYGDMPIFVAHESADVWANQELFCVDKKGRPTLVAGVPPDYFSKTGQLWGNPLYRWDVLAETNYAWWTARFATALRQFDLLRVDHFRGFEAYWEIPASARTAVAGTWRPGPGAAPFQAAREALGELPIIAEDLGMITAEVHALRESLGFPGMRVFQFGFDNVDDDFHRPDQFPEESAAYTGTHDNDTLMGWYKNRRPPREGIDPLAEIIKGEGEVHRKMIDAVLQSRSDIAIIPMQDLLGLGNEARMNLPGKAKGNWTWRVQAAVLTEQLSSSFREQTKKAGRVHFDL